MFKSCKGCTSRHVNCHSTCPSYEAAKKDFEERKAYVEKKNSYFNHISSNKKRGSR